ncbi:hypothetical protein BP6252_10298 [Coleophoma cylindrospora]|uniref:Rhodopsin domain-containing protein n=1 Tax=Coleophoma cylindrospora TaxID=1849047 RepID=A0A3D8QS90_9HELO|nr:hypothetical protein BP6252_10298 [Coleophoma cylindrospora]
MQIPPLAVIATWPPANYVDPVTRGPANTIMNLIFFPILLLVVGLRTYTRLRLSKSFGLDDALILAAMFPTAGFMIASLLGQLAFQENRHIWDMKPEYLIIGLKIEVAAQVIFSAACTLTKLSMLAMIQRIIPPQDYWTLSLEPQPQCIDRPANLLTAGIINTLTDFMVVILPIPTVYQLKLEPRQRMMVIVLFCVGFLVCFAGAARTVYTYLFSTSYDIPWTSFPVWISSLVELNVGIICASIPPTRPFFMHYTPGFMGIKKFSRASKTSAQPKGNSPDSTENSKDTIRSSCRVDIDLERLNLDEHHRSRDTPISPVRTESQRTLFSAGDYKEIDVCSDSGRYSDLSRTLSCSLTAPSIMSHPETSWQPIAPGKIYSRPFSDAS